jgi:hypothetical protein
VALARDAALAEALFREGRALMDAEDYAAACPKLRESFAQDETTGTLLALALCQERLGQTASAWANYAEVVSRSKSENRPDREAAAAERHAALEPTLSRLTVLVPEAVRQLPGLTIERDGKPLGAAAWGVGFPVDPGEHVVVVRADDKQQWSQTVTLGGAADQQTIAVPMLESLTSSDAHSGQALAPTAEPEVDDNTNQSPLPLRTIGLVTGGVGLLGLGGATYFGLRARSLNDDSNRSGHCRSDGGCDEYGLGKRKDAIQSADIATALTIVGAVLTGTGAALFIFGGDGSREESGIQAIPSIGPDIAALTLRRSF